MTLAEYNQCVERYADAVYRFILKNLGNEDQARDIVQDSYEKVWLKVAQIDALKAKSYLFTTAYRLMLEYIRKNKRFIHETKHLQILHSESQPEPDLKKVLDQAVSKLPDDQRSVILLRDYEGYNYKEISEITGLSEAQVKVYIFRARVFLKNYLVRTDLVV
jgi:RNA polymerase sigma factor (sigma-70 family)